MRGGIKIKTKTKTLCETCCRATAELCPYMRESDPLLGLAKVGVDPEDVIIYERHQGSHKPMKIYRIMRCPRYKPGSLPPVSWKKTIPRYARCGDDACGNGAY